MLAVSPPLRSNLEKDGNHNHREDDASKMEANFSVGEDEFPDFSGANNLLDSIDFEDLFMGMHDGDDLPDLEMDPELLAELGGQDQSEEADNSPGGDMSVSEHEVSNNGGFVGVEERGQAKERNNGVKKFPSIEKEEIQSRKDQEAEFTTSISIKSSIKERDKGKKSSLHTKTRNINSNNNNNNDQAKRKAKVDWTPELHRRFVQAVEQLGLDKAVPSRILELMGIQSLTRHNIASHLQKYRSHRKHLLAKEAEAATWTQKQQMYGVVGGGGKGGANISPWNPPTIMGFPPMTPMRHPFRPLHVWGHPTAPTIMDLRGRMPMWPRHHVVPPPTPPPPWTPPPPPPPLDPAFWHPPQHHRFTGAPLPAIRPPHAMYKQQNDTLSPFEASKTPPFDPHPSNESIDTAIGDVLAKPWLPLPIGLKPPSIDSVLVELQRQGIPKIPPSTP